MQLLILYHLVTTKATVALGGDDVRISGGPAAIGKAALSPR